MSLPPNDETTVETLPESKEDVIEFLGEEEEKPEVLDLPKPKEEKETEEETEPEEDDELKEIEEELKETINEDEDLELVTPVRRKEILAKYPKLFKEFPYLERAYYRDQKYTELLPTINDAKEAVEKASALDRFEQDLVSGNTESILDAVKKQDQQAFNKIVDNYLPTLAKVDPNAYNHVIGTIVKRAIIGMVQESRRTQNEALQTAAQLLNQFVFGTSEFIPPQQLAKTETQDPEADKLKKERENFAREKFETAQNDLSTRVFNTLKSTVDSYIDPKNSMTDYVKRNAVKDALDSLDSLIKNDTHFASINNKLWERAFQAGFSKDSLDKIRSAYLSKAKTLLPTVIKKARNEALRGSGKRVSDDKDLKGPITTGKPSTHKSAGPKEIPKGMKTLDYLMAD